MKSLFVILVITQLAIAQTTSPQPDAKSAELREASRLSRQVIELYNKDRYDEAIPLAKRSLEIRERALGADDPLTGDALLNLGSLYSGKKNYGQALSLYKRALAIFEKASTPDNAKISNTIHNMGWLYYAQGDTGSAEGLFQRSLSVREKALGPDHIDVAFALAILGQFYQQQLKYPKAVEYYKRALAVKEKALGPDHKEVGELAMKCACALLQNRQAQESKLMQKRASMILHNGPVDPNRMPGPVLQGQAIYRAEPEYPMAAKQGRISGPVIIEVTVDENGKVIDAKSICGHDILAAAALEAARKWQFTPTRLNGVPVKVIGIITFNFNL
jgi:TonB family protein